jgi:hypothetical protein
LALGSHANHHRLARRFNPIDEQQFGTDLERRINEFVECVSLAGETRDILAIRLPGARRLIPAGVDGVGFRHRAAPPARGVSGTGRSVLIGQSAAAR